MSSLAPHSQHYERDMTSGLTWREVDLDHVHTTSIGAIWGPVRVLDASAKPF